MHSNTKVRYKKYPILNFKNQVEKVEIFKGESELERSEIKLKCVTRISNCYDSQQKQDVGLSLIHLKL